MLTPNLTVLDRLLADATPDDPEAIFNATRDIDERTQLVRAALQHVLALNQLRQAVESFPLAPKQCKEIERFLHQAQAKERPYG